MGVGRAVAKRQRNHWEAKISRGSCEDEKEKFINGALQLLMTRYGYIRVRVRVNPSIGNSKSNHLGTQGTFKAEERGRGQGRGEETEEPLGGENLKRELRRQ